MFNECRRLDIVLLVLLPCTIISDDSALSSDESSMIRTSEVCRLEMISSLVIYEAIIHYSLACILPKVKLVWQK